MSMGSEYVVKVLVAEYGGGDAHRCPPEPFGGIDLGRERNAMRRGIDPHQHIDPLLVEQAFALVDGDISFRLRVREDRNDLIAFDPAALVCDVDGVFGAELGRDRSTTCERTCLVEDQADLDLLRLSQ